MNTAPILWLASASERRQVLLKQIQLPFEVLTVPADRDPERCAKQLKGETATQFALRMAKQKAEVAVEWVKTNALPIRPILTADTVVADDNRLYGKPASVEEAAQMLHSLSGHTHQVVTAITLYMPVSDYYQTVATTDVQFTALTDEKIARYLSSCNVLDKAGAYAVQEYAAIFIEALRGSYSNVVGLPLFETGRLLNAAGIQW